jgi:hypothetical protein
MEGSNSHQTGLPVGTLSSNPAFADPGVRLAGAQARARVRETANAAQEEDELTEQRVVMAVVAKAHRFARNACNFFKFVTAPCFFPRGALALAGPDATCTARISALNAASCMLMHCAVLKFAPHRIGLAYAEEDGTGDLCLTEFPSSQQAAAVATLTQLKATTRPSLILVCKGTEGWIIEALSRPVDQRLDTDSDAAVNVLPKVRRSRASLPLLTSPMQSAFLAAVAKQRILALPLEGAADLVSDADRELFASALIDFGKEQMLRAAGALLGHLGSAESRGGIRLREMSVSGSLRVDMDALQSLQIFRHEFHPSAAGIGGLKEGFSLFNLLNKARSAAGRRLLKAWVMRPLSDLAALQDRLDHVEALCDGRHAAVLRQAHAAISLIKDAPRICNRILNLLSTCSDWLALRATLAACLELRDLTRALASESELRVLRALQGVDAQVHMCGCFLFGWLLVSLCCVGFLMAGGRLCPSC